MARDVKAVVFDADGTLLDTREFILKAYEHTLEVFGLPVPSRPEIMKSMGLSLVDCYKIFAPDGDNAALCETHHVYQENNFQLIDSYEGLIHTLDTLRAHGLKIAICSSRSGHLHTALEHVGIKEHCDAIVGGRDVAKHKPDPEGFLKALAMVGVDPAHAAMVGDTVQDVETGKNGGAAVTIAVTHGFGVRDALQKAGAEYIVDRLPDILPILIGEYHG